jgi:CheY-like chemotaxis protein
VVRLRGVSEELRLLLVLTRLEDQFVVDNLGMTGPGPDPPPLPRILFVEDEQALAAAYGRFFAGRYAMAFADTGERAITQLEAFGPDLLVLDMNLPDTDGVDVLRQLRGQRPGLPVVVTTAYASMQPLLGVMGLEHNGFLIKPFELHELARSIEVALSPG